MTGKEIINELMKYPLDLEVTITDGFDCNCYHTRGAEFQIFKQDDGTEVIDIGIGGLRE